MTRRFKSGCRYSTRIFDPESLARSFAVCLRTVHHPKLPLIFDAILAVGPEHARVFHEAGWDKQQLLAHPGSDTADTARAAASG